MSTELCKVLNEKTEAHTDDFFVESLERVKLRDERRRRRLAVLESKQKPDGLDFYFEGMIQRHLSDMERVALAILKDRDSVEDVVSTAILNAYVSLFGFAPEEWERLSAKGWLCEIVRNLCFDLQEKRRREESLERLIDAGRDFMAKLYDWPENAALRADATAMIDGCLNTLTTREREIVRRVLMLGESRTQVAKDLGITLNNLYVIFDRGLRKLRHPQRSRWLTVRVDGVHEFVLDL